MRAAVYHDSRNSLGRSVCRLRRSHRISRRELAEAAGVDQEELVLLEQNLPVRLEIRRRVLQELLVRKYMPVKK